MPYPESSDVFITPIFEIVNSRKSPAFGGGIAIGAGDGVAVGGRLMYFADFEEFHTLEINLFIRFYLLGREAVHGPFIQLNGGAVVYDRHDSISLPEEVGTVSAFFLAGWRFLFGEHFFLEPAIRAGIPYLIGGGLSAGLRF